jgi:hypothetical protein
MNLPSVVSRDEWRAARSETGAKRWAAYIVQGFVLLFLLFDALPKVVQMDFAVEGSAEFGYSESMVSVIGITLLACTILYVVPRTAVLGAVLMTGYLGGAVASSIVAEEGLFYFPIIFGVFVWLGLYLRDSDRLQPIVPW